MNIVSLWCSDEYKLISFCFYIDISKKPIYLYRVEINAPLTGFLAIPGALALPV